MSVNPKIYRDDKNVEREVSYKGMRKNISSHCTVTNLYDPACGNGRHFTRSDGLQAFSALVFFD